ncbi:thiamine phosphate synthase [Solicola gregarius]|uniref:Thiamine-phosphate synthase n=1 Tax=Solicola gregarius TaxID=2908642 RepID=A0AA46TJ49_9ACTN|nr:thiamine phosphate synthase [Solicola gregarius]UYM05807.1 thiamine phosphate synthase [Solicola gregarius]
MLDPRLYLVTGDTRGRPLADIVGAAVDGGVTLVQLREKDARPDTLAARYDELSIAIGDTRVPILVNDDADVARTTGSAGVHVGPDDIAPAEARDLLGADALIGWSIHDLAQLGDTENVRASDYLAASPVWATATKTDTTAPLGLAGVAALRRSMPPHVPLVAIGGIDATNAADVIAAGADGIAVVSAICSAADPEAAACELRSTVDDALARRES